MKRFVLLVAIQMLMPSVSNAAQNCVTIGVLSEFKRAQSGAPMPYGEEIQRGVKAAIQSLNTPPGSSCVEAVDLDIGNTLGNIPVVIERAEKNLGIKFFIGLGLSDQVKVAINTLQEKHLLLFTPTASNDELNNPSNRIIMMFPRVSLVAKALAEECKRRRVSNVVTVFADNQAVSRAMRADFEKELISRNIKTKSSIQVRSKDINIRELAEVTKGLSADYFFVPLLENDAAPVIHFLNQRFPHATFIGTNAWGNYFQVIQAINGGRHLSAFAPLLYDEQFKTVQNQSFLKHFERINGLPPTHLAAFSFDAVLLLHHAIAKCGVENTLDNTEKCVQSLLPLESSTGFITHISGVNLERNISIYEFPK